jgi:hypothetical protein
MRRKAERTRYFVGTKGATHQALSVTVNIGSLADRAAAEAYRHRLEWDTIEETDLMGYTRTCAGTRSDRPQGQPRASRGRRPPGRRGAYGHNKRGCGEMQDGVSGGAGGQVSDRREAARRAA